MSAWWWRTLGLKGPTRDLGEVRKAFDARYRDPIYGGDLDEAKRLVDALEEGAAYCLGADDERE